MAVLDAVGINPPVVRVVRAVQVRAIAGRQEPPIQMLNSGDISNRATASRTPIVLEAPSYSVLNMNLIWSVTGPLM